MSLIHQPLRKPSIPMRKINDHPKDCHSFARRGSCTRYQTEEMDNPMSSSFVLYGIVNGRQSKFLKNDDCNTNITSGDFVEKNKYNNIINKKLDIEHCNDNYLEQ